LLPSIIKHNYMLELKSLLKSNDFWNKTNLYKSLEFVWMHLHKFTCFKPLLSYQVPLFLIQVMVFAKLTLFLWLKLKSSQHIPWNYLWHISNIWTLHGPNKPLQKVSTIPKLHKTQQKLMWKSWWRNYSFHLWHIHKHEH
jgi:hypothetical protein